MHAKQVYTFFGLLLGHRDIGVNSDGIAVTTPVNPEAMAFLSGYLGALAPEYPQHVFHDPRVREAVAGMLDEIVARLRNRDTPEAGS